MGFSCTKAYLTEHPCNEPWLPPEGDTGPCTVTIEQHMRRFGPSRQIFSVVAGATALSCLCLSVMQIVDIWTSSPLRQHGRRGFHVFIGLPSTQMYAGACYSMAFMIPYAVDIFGWGNRIPFFASVALLEQATFGTLVMMINGLVTWHRVLTIGRRKGPSVRVAILKWSAIGVCFVNHTLLSVLEVLVRPRDAPLGVYNTAINAIKLIVSGVCVTAGLVIFTIQFTKLRAKLNASIRILRLHMQERLELQRQLEACAAAQADELRNSRGASDAAESADAATVELCPATAGDQHGARRPDSIGSETHTSTSAEAPLPHSRRLVLPPITRAGARTDAAGMARTQAEEKGTPARCLPPDEAAQRQTCDAGEVRSAAHDGTAPATRRPGGPRDDSAAEPDEPSRQDRCRSRRRRISRLSGQVLPLADGFDEEQADELPRIEAKPSQLIDHFKLRALREKENVLRHMVTFIVVVWVCCFVSIIYVTRAVIARLPHCWDWSNVRATNQWFEFVVLMLLLIQVTFTYTSQKVKPKTRAAALFPRDHAALLQTSSSPPTQPPRAWEPRGGGGGGGDAAGGRAGGGGGAGGGGVGSGKAAPGASGKGWGSSTSAW